MTAPLDERLLPKLAETICSTICEGDAPAAIPDADNPRHRIAACYEHQRAAAALLPVVARERWDAIAPGSTPTPHRSPAPGATPNPANPAEGPAAHTTTTTPAGSRTRATSWSPNGARRPAVPDLLAWLLGTRCPACGQRTRRISLHWYVDHAGDTGIRR